MEGGEGGGNTDSTAGLHILSSWYKMTILFIFFFVLYTSSVFLLDETFCVREGGALWCYCSSSIYDSSNMAANFPHSRSDKATRWTSISDSDRILNVGSFEVITPTSSSEGLKSIDRTVDRHEIAVSIVWL